MEVILLERVEKLGQMGDKVRVKDGFARNYLLPLKKALRATDDNVARFEKERARLEAQNLTRRQDATAVAGKMDGISVTLLRQASESAQLYGSVNGRDIAEAITAAGYSVGKAQVQLTQPIKALGMHQVRVALHPEVAVTVNVNVARSEAEAEIQAAGGKLASAEEFFEEGAAPEAAEESAAEETEK